MAEEERTYKDELRDLRQALINLGGVPRRLTVQDLLAWVYAECGPADNRWADEGLTPPAAAAGRG